MINGLGVVGWGVGGIEAEAGMLGQPVYFLTPEVVGVHLTGTLKEGVTATDLVLRVTEMLRKQKVVGKFVEFFGEGAAALSVTDRATIGNMAPEYGATMGFFGVDEETLAYLRGTGRSEELCETFENYYKAQGLWGIPRKGEVDYTVELELDLGTIVPGVAGPKRPQDRINLPELKQTFEALFEKPLAEGGYGKKTGDLLLRVPVRINGSSPPATQLEMPSTDTSTNHRRRGSAAGRGGNDPKSSDARQTGRFRFGLPRRRIRRSATEAFLLPRSQAARIRAIPVSCSARRCLPRRLSSWD